MRFLLILPVSNISPFSPLLPLRSEKKYPVCSLSLPDDSDLKNSLFNILSDRIHMFFRNNLYFFTL